MKPTPPQSSRLKEKWGIELEEKFEKFWQKVGNSSYKSPIWLTDLVVIFTQTVSQESYERGRKEEKNKFSKGLDKVKTFCYKNKWYYDMGQVENLTRDTKYKKKYVMGIDFAYPIKNKAKKQTSGRKK